MKPAIATQREPIAGFSFARCRCALGMEIFSNGSELSLTSAEERLRELRTNISETSRTSMGAEI
jgi:hypothetical protein